jgi:hypothetical protein
MAIPLRGKPEWQVREFNIFTALAAHSKVIDCQRGEEKPQHYNAFTGAR